MIDLYANCAGVVFPPVDEDLGYITLEAMLCEKPVVTTTDAGEPARIIRDGIEGFVAEPTPQALGSALSKLMQKPERMGKAARQRFDSMHISWDYAIEQLIGQAQEATPKVTIKADKTKADNKEKTTVSDYTPQRNITEYWKGRLHSSPFEALREFAAPALETARRTLVITSQKPANPSFGSWISLQEQDLERTEISYPDQYFDTVLMDQSLEKLLHNPAYVLYQLRRVLKPNGSIVILTPDAEKDHSKQVFDPSGLPPLARYTRDMLEILLTGLGYQVQQLESWKINDDTRGLFVLAQKQTTLENPQILQKLYQNDPGQLMANLEQITSDDPSVITVRAQNTGWSNWTPQTICLTVYRKDSMGHKSVHLHVLLTQDVAPDASADFSFQVHETCEGIDSPRWILELCQIDRQTMRVVPISGSGLAHPIVLLANTVTPYHVAA
jgi:SAM-dependent methyltransferase